MERTLNQVSLAVGLPVADQLFAAHEQHRLVDLARMADDAGADTLLVVDHVVMSTRLDRYRWGPFRFSVEAPWMEPLALLAAMAAATRRVRLATNILIAPLRPAALLAKMAATIDVLSQGRLELGVGTGWQPEEYEAEGLDFVQRGRALTDTIGACRALWSASPAEFRSPTVSFENVWCEPKPVQPGGPPVLFAGTLTDRNRERITNLGDGWIPIMGATHEEIGAGVAALKDAWEAAGRDSRRLKVRAPLPIVRRDDGSRDLDGTLAGAAALAEIGVTEVTVTTAAFVRDPSDAGRWFEQLGERWAAHAG
jgi:probable F420-dependent oxidoreductase